MHATQHLPPTRGPQPCWYALAAGQIALSSLPVITSLGAPPKMASVDLLLKMLYVIGHFPLFESVLLNHATSSSPKHVRTPR
ncbi:hypothetical protein RRG08_020065 [Elysia crispata]|uniref:Uncharacterized protein n=1 Tax=Elysia crispata TaxID=231223 RepID=A0AAE1D8Y8_9GAST|nr:hypothetical protein RRG08_020065 [Elysia crispata]